MFERFTKDARAVVLGALDHAERSHANEVTEEHLLLSLLDRKASRASFALAALGLTDRRDSVVRALAEARRRGGFSRADMDALSGLGIDLSEIVSRVEEAHGVGALESGRKGNRNGWGLRSGHRPFTRDAKDVLTRSLRTAHAHRDLPHARIRSRGGTTIIGDEHLLLALTTRPGALAEVLADHGVTYEALERVLYGAGEAKAG